MTNPPSDSSYTMAEAEVEEHEDILEDLSDSDTDSDDNKTKIIVMMTTKRKNKKPSYLSTTLKIISIPPWVVRTFKYCSPWPLGVIQWIYWTTRILHSVDQKPTIPK